MSGEKLQNLDLATLHFFIDTFSFLWREEWEQARSERRAEEADFASRLGHREVLKYSPEKEKQQKEEKERLKKEREKFLSTNEFIVFDTPPTDEERQTFQQYLEKGSLEIRGNEVHVMAPSSGGLFSMGHINLENGWVISDFPWGRMGGFPLYIAREIGGWEDPSGKGRHVRNPIATNARARAVEVEVLQKKEKVKNPYAPTSRKHRRGQH